MIRMRLHQAHPPSHEEIQSQSEAAKGLYSQWDQLEVHNGLVYRRWALSGNRGEVLQLLVPGALRQDYIRMAHTGITGGHLGVRRTLDQVQRRAFWRGWRGDVRRYVQRCSNCNGYFRGHLPRTAPLQPMLSGAPFEKLHYDLTGPHPRSRRGSVYILTRICPFSKWAEAFPIPNKEAATIARVLVEQVICRFGTPIAAISDRGRDVDGHLMNEICRLLDIDKIRTTSYHPASNGAIERFHATLNSLIGRVIDEHQSDWDSLLPYVMAAYRASRHESTQFTPNMLVLGREVRSPVDIVYQTPETPHPISYASYADELRCRMQEAYTLVREHLRVSAERTKRAYDIRVRPRRYEVGDWVYYFNPRRFVGRQDKWRRKYDGPFLVTKVIGAVNVMLQRTKRSKPFCVHLDKLKPYTGESVPVSWLGGETPNHPSGDTVSGSVPVATAPDSEAPLMDVEDSITLDVPEMLDQSSAADAIDLQQDSVPQRRVDETEVKQLLQDGDDNRIGNDYDHDAIAGVPTVVARSPRPRRRIWRPRRYQDYVQ